MLSAKNQMLKIIQEQPENRSHKEILRKDATMVGHGLADSLRTISDEERQRQIKSMCLSMLLLDEETLEDLEHIQDVKEMIQLFRSGEDGDISFERIR